MKTVLLLNATLKCKILNFLVNIHWNTKEYLITGLSCSKSKNIAHSSKNTDYFASIHCSFHTCSITISLGLFQTIEKFCAWYVHTECMFCLNNVQKTAINMFKDIGAMCLDWMILYFKGRIKPIGDTYVLFEWSALLSHYLSQMPSKNHSFSVFCASPVDTLKRQGYCLRPPILDTLRIGAILRNRKRRIFY